MSSTPFNLDSTESGLRRALFWFLSSFLCGLGLSLSLTLVVWLAYKVGESNTTKPDTSKISSRSWYKRFSPGARLVVASTNPRRTEHNLVVLGTLRNDGTDSWDSVDIQVQLFGKDDQLVGLCRSWMTAVIRPGQERYFSVDCDGRESSPVAQYERHVVEVVDADYKMEEDP
ncbi:MAG TPA: FxLYD domain-containing protein [Candidatus Polarisedimenticolia bacterium]|nr:FxLYD domain-containing protein [Candidatus Polarisedimenticolia bacterium]